VPFQWWWVQVQWTTGPSCCARLYSRMHQRSTTQVCYQHKCASSTLHRLNHACQANSTFYTSLRVGDHLELSLHSLNESSALLKWLYHDDSTINTGFSFITVLLQPGTGVSRASIKIAMFPQESGGGWRKDKARPVVAVSVLCSLHCLDTVSLVTGRTSDL